MSAAATRVQSTTPRRELLHLVPTRPAAAPEPRTKPASASRVTKTLLVVPALVQHYGTLFGGTLMALVVTEAPRGLQLQVTAGSPRQ